MKTRAPSLISLLAVVVAGIRCECDVCQSTNFVACLKENVYSLCVNGSATNDFITCPENSVCTPGPYVCYPLPEAKPSCERKANLCGVCSENKVYACTNETTVAFCYGSDKPVEGAAVSYCSGDTVCDIYSKNGFCSESFLVEPSCVTSGSRKVDTTTKIATTTTETTTLDTTQLSTEPISITSKLQPITIAATTTVTKPPALLTTATTTTEAKRQHTTTEPTVATTMFKITTASRPSEPDDICKLHATTGSFPVEDPTCASFVVCYKMGGKITGLKKKCRNNQYFSPGSKACSSQKPDFCI